MRLCLVHYSILKMKRTPTEPKYDIVEARQTIAQKLNLPYRDSMQDWPWEVAKPGEIESYIRLYDQTIDEDELFLLMGMLLQVTTTLFPLSPGISIFDFYVQKCIQSFVN
jgi:hypothetical protein